MPSWLCCLCAVCQARHCRSAPPHCLKNSRLPKTPTPTLQERMHVVWQELVNSGQLAPTDFVRVTSTAAAQIFNVYPRKGVVRGVGCARVAVDTCLVGTGGGLRGNLDFLVGGAGNSWLLHCCRMCQLLTQRSHPPQSSTVA